MSPHMLIAADGLKLEDSTGRRRSLAGDLMQRSHAWGADARSAGAVHGKRAYFGDSEVRRHVAVGVGGGLRHLIHTRNIGLLVSFRSRSSLESPPQMVTNFPIGTLA